MHKGHLLITIVVVLVLVLVAYWQLLDVTATTLVRWSVIAALAATSAAVLSAGQNFWSLQLSAGMLDEARIQREQNSTPKVGAWLEPDPRGTVTARVVIMNVGSGPAYKISFSHEREPGDASERLSYLDETVIDFMSPQRQVTYNVGRMVDFPEKPILLNVSYATAAGPDSERVTDPYSLSIRDMDPVLVRTLREKAAYE
jgi:hypothetical protein